MRNLALFVSNNTTHIAPGPGPVFSVLFWLILGKRQEVLPNLGQPWTEAVWRGAGPSASRQRAGKKARPTVHSIVIFCIRECTTAAESVRVE
jgi:hypothetical protein